MTLDGKQQQEFMNQVVDLVQKLADDFGLSDEVAIRHGDPTVLSVRGMLEAEEGEPEYIELALQISEDLQAATESTREVSGIAEDPEDFEERYSGFRTETTIGGAFADVSQDSEPIHNEDRSNNELGFVSTSQDLSELSEYLRRFNDQRKEGESSEKPESTNPE